MRPVPSFDRTQTLARRHARARLLAAAVSLLLATARNADALLYDVDFSSPPHTVGQLPATGSGPTPRQTVSQVIFGTPTVVAALGALADQPLELTSFDGQGDQVKFELDDLAEASFYCFQSDVLVTQAAPDGFLTFFFDAPDGSRTIYFGPSGEIRARVLGNPDDLIGTFALGTVVHLQVEIDLVNDRWVIHLDGQEVWADSFGQADRLVGLRVTTPVLPSPAGVTGAIDNLTINDGICDERPCDRLAFDELTAGATYAVGSSFASEGVIIDVEPFYATPGLCGGASVSGSAVVDLGQQNACRTGREIRVENVTLDFNFGGTVDDVVIYYGEYGGTVSLGVNGVCKTVQDFPVLDGTVQGTVAVEVFDSGAAGGCGVIRLLGEIAQLSIGGQELWIDAVSYCHVCPDLMRSAYEDQTLGTTYNVGDEFTSGAAAYRVMPFFPPGPDCTMPVFGGFAEIQNGGLACGNGNELNLNNANVRITFGADLERLVLNYGEYGGNVNLTINGDCRNVDNFNVLNATDVGGVRVIVADFDESGQSCGMMYLVGPIEQFGIGGQELLIDNLRACGPEVAGIADPIGAPGVGAEGLELEQNQPNPFNPSTRIGFTLATRMRAQVTIYDITGRAVRTLIDGMVGSGRHEVLWDGLDARGSRVSSGVYLYRLEAGGMASTRRMIILK